MKFIKRLYWKYKFSRLSPSDKIKMEFMGIDPASLIKRGEL